MDREETKAKFAKAKELYRAGRYEESLGILEELNRIYPVTKNVLFPMALNLRALGRFDEALAICEEVILNFDAEKAHNLRKQLELDLAAQESSEANQDQAMDLLSDVGPVQGAGNPDDTGKVDAVGGGLDLDSLNAQLDEPVGSTKPVMVNRGGGVPWGQILGLTAGLIAIFVIGSIVVFAFVDGLTNEGTGGDGGSGETFGFTIVFWLLSAVFGWGVQSIVMYVTLLIMNSLPEPDLKGNVVNIGVVSFIMMLIQIIPIIGGIASLIYFIQTYDIGFLGCIVYVFMMLLVFGALVGLLFALIAASGVPLEEIDTGMRQGEALYAWSHTVTAAIRPG